MKEFLADLYWNVAAIGLVGLMGICLVLGGDRYVALHQESWTRVPVPDNVLFPEELSLYRGARGDRPAGPFSSPSSVVPGDFESRRFH
jgi:hypothetical protein